MSAFERDENVLRIVRTSNLASLRFARTHLFEWVSSCIMVSMALEIGLTRGLAARTGSYGVMTSLGIPDWFFILFFLLFGATRCAALYLNGQAYPYGPFLRMVVSVWGALVWGQLGVALLVSLIVTHTMNIGLSIYFFLAMGELVSCYRAAYDARHGSE